MSQYRATMETIKHQLGAFCVANDVYRLKTFLEEVDDVPQRLRQYALLEASKHGSAEVVEMLLHKPDFKSDLNELWCSRNNHYYGYHCACDCDYNDLDSLGVSVVRACLESSATPIAKDRILTAVTSSVIADENEKYYTWQVVLALCGSEEGIKHAVQLLDEGAECIPVRWMDDIVDAKYEGVQDEDDVDRYIVLIFDKFYDGLTRCCRKGLDTVLEHCNKFLFEDDLGQDMLRYVLTDMVDDEYEGLSDVISALAIHGFKFSEEFMNKNKHHVKLTINDLLATLQAASSTIACAWKQYAERRRVKASIVIQQWWRSVYYRPNRKGGVDAIDRLRNSH